MNTRSLLSRLALAYLGFLATELHATGGDTFPNFAWNNPLPEGGTLQTVVFAQSKFVAAGVGGRVLTSTDGSTWSLAAPIPFEAVYSVCYSGSQYVAVGYGGRSFTSSNLTSWTPGGPNPTGNTLNGVVFADTRYVAVGYNGTILSSADGSNWTMRTSPTNQALFAVAGTTGRYVAVGSNGAIVTSTDAAAWSNVTPPAGYASTQFNGVSFLNGQFVAVGGNGAVIASSDGTNWTAHPTGVNEWLHGIIYTGSTYVATADSGVAMTSGDLAAWTRIQLTTSAPLFGVAVGGGTIVAVGAGGEIDSSTDGASWNAHGSTGGSYAVYDSTFVNGQFVAVGANGFVSVSGDGSVWNRRTTNSGHFLNGIAFGAGLYVAVTGFGDMLTSPDTNTWTDLTVGDNGQNFGIVFANGQFVVVGSGGMIRTSADGTAWSTVTGTGITANLRSVAALGGTYVAVGDGGNIYTSTNGTGWTAQTSGTGWNLNRVRVIDGTLFAVGDSRTVLVSTNGVTWVPLPDGQLGWQHRDIARLHDGYYVVGSNGDLLKSADLQTWTRIAKLADQEDLWTIATGAGRAAVGGNGGSLLETALPATGVAPAIVVPPAGRKAANGDNVVLSVIATGTAPLSYQWKKNGTDVGGATAAVLILPNAQAAAAGDYTVVVSGTGGPSATSSAATVAVGAPVIGSALTASGTAGVPFTYNIGASNSPTGYGASGVPAGLSFNSATGVISGTPSAAGTFNVTISATNAGGTDTRNLAIFVVAAGSDAFPNFAWRNPLPAGGTLQTVIYAQNKFVAAGVGGRVMTSSNGTTWTASANPLSTEMIYGLAYDGTQFIAVGSSGKIFTTTDPTAAWTQRASAPQWFYGVTVAGGNDVAVGGNGTIYTSTNGTSWSAATSPTNNSLQAVAGTSGHYVAVGQNGTLLHSTDAATWTIVAAPNGYTSTQFNGVVYLNNQFVVVGANGSVLSSPNGTAGSWTAHVTGNGDWLHTVAYDGTKYVVATDGNSVYVSPDLVSWSFHPLPVNTPLFALGYNGVDTFVAVGGGGEIWSSTDTTNWTSRGATGGAYRMIDVTAKPNGSFLAVGSSGLFANSGDGVSWTRSHLPNSNWSNGVAASATVIVAVSGFGDIASSADGFNWVDHTVGDNFSNNGVAYGQSIFVAVGDQGRFRTSSDGANWNTGSIAGLSSSLRSVAGFGNLFIAVGDLGKIYTSTDGSNWTARTSGTNWNLQRVRVLDGAVFAVGDNRTVLVSTDGMTWLTVAQSTDYNTFGYSYRDIAHLPDGFYIASSQGQFVKSPTLSTTDMSTWTRVAQLAFGENLNAIAVSGGKVVVAADGGTLMESTLPTAGTAPAITLPPATQTAFTGSNLLLSVGATGSGPLTYQWKKDGNDIAGATAAVLVLANAQPGATGSYTVVVSGTGGSPATSTGAAVTINAAVAPVITSLPLAAQTITAGANLSVAASGTAPLAYQWYRGLPGDTSIPVSTSSNYTTPPLTTSEHYWVRVSNSGGSVDSPATTALALGPVNPTSVTNGINGLAYGNSTYVAVVYGNTILTSSDNGLTWVRRAGLTGTSLRGVAFGGGVFVAVGGDGGNSLIRTSSDNGVTWSTASFGSNQLNGVIYDGAQFVAVGNNSTVLTSPTGASWTSQSLGSPGVNLQGIASGGSPLTYVAVGQNGAIYTSTNTTGWTAQTSGTANTLYGAAFGGGKFVVVGNSGTILTSSDATAGSWSAATSNTTTNLNTVVFGNGLFVAAGGSVFSSPDGATWTNTSFTPSLSGSNSSSMNASVYANNQFVMGGFAGAIFISPTAANGSWVLRNTLVTTGINDVIYAAGRLVLAGNVGVIVTFPDGGAPAANLPAVSGVTNTLRRAAYGKGLYVVVGDGGRILTSPDTLVWTNRTLGSTNYTALAYGNGLFVAAGAGGVYATSGDGVTWTTGSGTIGSANVAALAYGAGVFVAVNSSGGIYTSASGTGWAAQSSPVGSALNHVTFAGGQFVAVGANSVVLTSPAGTNWTAQTLGTSGIALNKVAYGDGLYLAVHSGPSNSQSIFFSRDGVTWNSTNPNNSINEFSATTATYGNGGFVITGAGALTFQTLPASDTLHIDAQPANQTFTSGQTVALNVAATNATGYQWFEGASGDISNPVASATSASFTTPALTQSKLYWVRTTGSNGTLDSATATLRGPPTITAGPVAQTVSDGTSNVSFSVAAFGAGTLTYQWRLNGSDIAGATSPVYTIPLISAANAGSYVVVVSNGTDSTPSTPVMLTVNAAAPTMSQQSSFGLGTIVQAGSAVDLQMFVSGTAPMTVQWQKNSANLGAPVSPDATGIAHYYLFGAQKSDQGPYTAVATNSVGSSSVVTNNQAQFVVEKPSWSWRQPFPTPQAINNVIAKPSGGFLIVGQRGYFADSDDGAVWSQAVGLTSQTLLGYVTGNKRQVVWGSNFFGTAALNGADVALGYLPSFETVNEVVFAKGLFVAICSSGKIFTSPDALNWTERPSGIAEQLFEATFGNNRFVVSSASGKIITSTDGMNWSNPAASPSDNVWLLRFANGLFYLGNTTGQLYTSSDAATWTPVTMPAGFATRIMDLQYARYNNADHYVIVGSGGTILTSPSGASNSWTQRASGVTTNLLYSAYSNGAWVAIGNNNSTGSNGSVILRSADDGVTWARQSGSITTQQLNGVATDGTNAVVAVGNSGTVLRSTDGWSWQSANNGINGVNLNEVTYYAGTGAGYYAVGAGGAIRSSSDGGNNSSWSSPTSGTTNNLNWVGTLKTTLAAAGAGGTLLTSANGTTWATVATGSSAQLNGAAYGLVSATDTYVAVGNGGVILKSSPTLSSWSSMTSGTVQNLAGVAFGSGKFVAVGDNGTILTSADGVSWVSQSIAVPENFTRVAFTSNLFVVSGSASGVFVSPDGITWTSHLAGTSAAVAIRATSGAIGGRVYGVGTGGAILAADLIPQVENVTVTDPVVSGGKATFRVDNFLPLLPVTYQWSRGGIAIPGATNATYVIPNATRADAGLYDVTLDTSARDTGSDVVQLNVAPTAYPGQLAADLSWDPNPLTISTRTFAAVQLSDGKFLVGGEAVRWQDSSGQLQTRTALARLNSDLTLDTSWTPPVVNGIVYALAVAPDGSVYFGGEFNAVDGHSRPNLARLIVVNGNLVHDLAWRPADPQPTGGTFQVSALAVQTDGKLLVARQSFVPGVVGGTNVLRRLNVDGSLDGTFSTNLTVGTGPRVTSIVAEPIVNGDLVNTGKIAFAGSFTQVNSVATNAIARVSNDGATVDTNFASNNGASGGANNTVNFLSRLSDGRYLVVGNFGQVGGLTRNHIALLTAANGSVDTAFVTATAGTTNGTIQAATLLPDTGSGERIVAIGGFTQYGGINAANIVRLNGTTGAVDTGFTIGAGAQVNTLSTSGAGRNVHAFTLAGNKVGLVGIFNQILGQRRIAVAILDGAAANADAADPTKTLLATPASLVYRPAFTGAAFLESNGELTVFGSIDAAAGVSPLGQMARFKPDGSIDTNFPGGSGLGLTGLSTFGVYRGTRQGDGKYVVIGDIATYNGSAANHIVRINPDGSIDSSFQPGTGPNNYVLTPYALSGGKTLLYGFFVSAGVPFTYNGVSVSGNIMRLNADGTRDTGFNPGGGFGGGAPAAAIEVPDSQSPGGKPIIVGGSFTTYNGATVPGIVAINPDGTRVDPVAFDLGSGPGGGSIAGFAFLSPGRLLVYGSFTTFNGSAANHMAVVDFGDNGFVLDPNFTAPAELDAVVGQAVVQEDGRIIVTGEFSRGLALRLNADGTFDPSFALQGITGYPGGGASTRLIVADDGSVYLHNGLFSLNNQAPRALVRFKGAVTAPLIAVPPASGTLTLGVDNLLWVRAGGTGPYTYQWRKGGAPLSGATDSVLVIHNATAADAGSYDVIVTGPGGSVTSGAATLATTVSILDQPTSRRVVAGGKVLFRVSASTTVGGATLTYKWQKNGADIGGATASDYTIPSVAAGDAATYSVVVGDGTNSISSQPAVLTVLTPDPVLWQQFTEFAVEQSLERTINDGNGHVYVPWGIYDRNDDMVGGRVMGALARFNVSDGSVDPTFKLDPRYSRASHLGFQSDGRLIVAVTVGDVDTVIRVDTTGAVDGTFQAPLFARGIRFVTVQPDGKVLVAASELPHIDAPAGALAAATPGIYRLDGTNGHVDGGFTPATLGADAGGNVAIFGPPVVDGSNRIYLVGIFGAVNGTARPNFARLAPDGTLDSTFANSATLPAGFVSQQARAVVFQSAGKAVIVGGFSYNGRGQTNGDRIMAIRMNVSGLSDGAFDASYHMPLRSELGYNTSIGIRMRYAMALPNDQLLGVSDRLTRLNGDGTVDGTFKSRAFGQESFWVSQDANGRFYVPDQISVAGNALTLQLWGNGIARFAPDGTPDESFQTGGWGRSALPTKGAVLSDGRVWVAGDFNRFGSTYLPGLAQFAAAGGLTGTQVASNRSMPYGDLAPAGNDQIFALVSPSSYSVESSSPVFARLNADGTPDGSFTPALPAGYVLGSATPTAAASGKVLLAQAFIDPLSVLNGATGDSLLRLNANGSRDGNFNPPLASLAAVDRDGSNNVIQIRTAGISVAQVLADDRVLVVNAGLDGSLHLARLTATGALDGGFNAPSFGTVTPETGLSNTVTDPVSHVTAQFDLAIYNPTDLVRTAVQMPDGHVYVGGRFALSGKPRGLVRLNTDGTLDSTFTGAGIAFSKADAGPYVDSLAVDAAGRLYVAGRFDSFNGAAVPGLFRLNADGSFDAAWAPGFAVRDVPAASVRLTVVGTKLYAFGTVAAAADAFEGPYRVVDIPPPPSISTPPVTANVVLGGSATFTVGAGGTGPLTYQWFKNGASIGGATNASYTVNPVGANDAASYTVAITGPTGTTVSAPVPLVINTPVSIATPPLSQALSSGASFTLTVGLHGTAPFTYQWSKDGTAITGATDASYTVTAATNIGTGSAGFGTTGDAGDYTVFVTNAVGNATSTPAATVTVLPPGFSATHALVGNGYVAGGTVTITNTFNYSGALSAVGWHVLLPAGWSFASDSGTAGASSPDVGLTDVLEWFWITPPASGTTFTYTLNVPAGTTGPQTIVALYQPRQSGTQYTLLAKPDPLTINQVTFHSADTGNGTTIGTPDGKIELTELLRVIELYNTRNGTVRTGAYAVDPTNTEDGFTGDPVRTNSAVVTLTRYHSADTGDGTTVGTPDGKLELTELLRVIELYNYRSGTVRTGEYHVEAGTEDGFGPGPAPAP